MNLKKTGLASLIASACFAANVYAQDVVVSLEQPDQTIASIAVSEEDSADVIDRKLTDYVSEKEDLIAKAGKSNLIRFFSGQAEISVTASNPDWAVFRSMALAEAMHKARDSYLKTLNRDFSEQQVREFFREKGLPEPTAQDFKSQNRFEALMGKAIALADGYLSKELEKMGISANEFASAPPEKKQLLMRQYFENRTISAAYGDLSGMFVVKTFEQYEKTGRGTIGVVMTLSLNKRDKVVDLIESEGNVQPDLARKNPRNANLKAYLKGQATPYLNAGTDLMYDAQGYPMLVAFGQYGVVYTSDRDERTFEREAAEGYAEDAAWSALAGAYNLSGEFARQSMQAKQNEKSRSTSLIGPNATRTSETAIQQSIRSTVDESSKTTASLKGMTGVSVEHKWRMKHPATQHEMVGVVLVWHPIKVRDTITMQSGLRADEIEQQQSPKAPSLPSSVGQEGFESEDRFDLSDF